MRISLYARSVALLLAASSLLCARVKTGLDVLVEQDFAPLAGKRVGVIANQNTRTWDHRSIVSVMAKSGRFRLTAIFTPEHGFSGQGQAGESMASGKDEESGVPVYSLYNRGSYRPTPEMLAKVDALVYDLQDVGARFYSYPATLAYVMKAAAPAHIPVFVLDRPNPINGVAVQGPVVDPKYMSMIGYGQRPFRHGMTIGEMALFFNAENKIGADLHVIKMEGWKRAMWMDETGLEWINPSPNLRSLTAVILYPGVCLVENTMVSVGRGTDTPFQMMGAPWMKGLELADYLNGRAIPGVRFMARRFTPSEAPYKGQECSGVEVELLNRDELNASRLGLELLGALLKFHPDKFTLDQKIMLLLGSDKAAELLKAGKTGAEVDDALAGETEAFRKVREKYLLY